MNYYISRDGQQFGPYTLAEVQRYVADGNILLTDLAHSEGMAGWEFRSEVIWLTPSSIAVDLRIRGEFGPAALTSDDSVLISHPRIGYVVAYGTAALVAMWARWRRRQRCR